MVRSVTIPGREAQMKPEARKAGAKAQRWAHVSDVYTRGECSSQDLIEALKIRRMLRIVTEEEVEMGRAGELIEGMEKGGDSSEDLEVITTGTGGDNQGGKGDGNGTRQ